MWAMRPRAYLVSAMVFRLFVAGRGFYDATVAGETFDRAFLAAYPKLAPLNESLATAVGGTW